MSLHHSIFKLPFLVHSIELPDGDAIASFKLPDDCDFIRISDTAIGSATALIRSPTIFGFGELQLASRYNAPICSRNFFSGKMIYVKNKNKTLFIRSPFVSATPRVISISCYR